ncbi:uncharacterized protein LOC105844804 isoform X2 [Hydra vulgaris]|uniref:uncharacterized protein LOC105844804 isoform X2 n=1 Tax=Hydra vulgaris TaxID=6087 RepID=UPI001F5F19F6|nr:uncharacterized protein LOC105844804 isoform X2 [Hydra vulgaris]
MGEMYSYVLLVFFITGFKCNLLFEVDSIYGTDNITCLNGKKPCKSLNYVFTNIKNMSHSTLKILKGVYKISTDIRVNDLVSMEIVSFDNPLLKCVNSSGLTFISSTNITIRGVTIKNCGVKHNKIEYKKEGNFYHSFMSTAICFTKCKDVFIDNVIFQENEGVALAFFDVCSSVQIYQSSFESNVNFITRENISVGGGVYVEFTNYTSLSSFINADTKYFIKKCNFSNNSLVSGLKQIDMSTKVQQKIYARGAGLSIVLGGHAKGNLLNIVDCLFINNTALWGGGMFLFLAEASENNSIFINGCIFKANKACLAGGGIRVYEESKQKITTTENNIQLENVLFNKNSAIWGGGVSIKGTKQGLYKYEDMTANVFFYKCIFDENFGTVGFAIGLHTRNFNRRIYDRGVSYRVVIKNCLFNKNQMKLTEDEKVIGQGCIYFKEALLVLTGNNSFTCNQGTAVVLESSSLTFGKSSYSVFQNNTGTEGGAIALYGTSWLELEKYSNLLFVRNSALRRGGALYVKHGGPRRVAFQNTEMQTSPCFIQYKGIDTFEWPVNITFRANYAPPNFGNSIWASTLQYCRSDGESRINSTALVWPFIKYESSSTDPEIVTSPVELNFDKEQWNVSPYFPFSTDVRQIDERGQSVFGSVKIIITSENQSVTLDPPNYDFLVRDEISKLRLLGKTQSKFSVTLVTNNEQLVVSPAYNVSLNLCLPGFREIENKCVCMNAEFGDVVRCLENGTVYILRGRWGYVSNKTSLLETIVCPKSYCKCHSNIEEYLCEFDVKEQCSQNRQGRLCSQCSEGYSVAILNEDCKICTTNGTQITLVFLLILGLLLFYFILLVALLYFDVDFSGYFNVFFYWYQTIDLVIPANVQLTSGTLFLIGFSSLTGTGENTGFCLYNGLDNLTKLALNYVPPVLFIFTAVMLHFDCIWKVFCLRKFKQLSIEECSDKQKISRGKALGFVIVVTFFQIITVSFKLLDPIEIDGELYVNKAAFAKYFRPPHIFFGLLAVCFLVVIVLFLLFLIFNPKFIRSHKYIGKKYCRYIVPVFDALKSCFNKSKIIGKDTSQQEREIKIKSRHQRMFAAFYFVCRVIMIMISVIINNEIIEHIFLSSASVIILTIFATYQPYREPYFNYWDILTLLFMCIASLISLILSVPYVTSQTNLNGIIVFLEILIWLPMGILLLRLGRPICIWLLIKCGLKDFFKDENMSINEVPIRGMECISNEKINYASNEENQL